MPEKARNPKKGQKKPEKYQKLKKFQIFKNARF